jgi:Xaa-Pro aminopeptidase
MKSYFTSDFFIGNRQRLRKLFVGNAPIILSANGLMQRNNDQSFPFRQESNFWYLTGIDEPDIILVMDKDREYLILPARSDVQEIFDDASSKEKLAQKSGIEEVLDQKAGWKRLEQKIKRSKHAASLTPPPVFIDVYGFHTNPARALLHSRLKEVNGSLEMLDLREQFARMRMVKQPTELAATQTAIDLTVKTLKSVKRNMSKYKFEYEIEAAVSNAFISKGYHDVWPPIVSAGKNACVIHHQDHRYPINSKDLVVIDIGAEVENYASDITRTYAAGTTTKRQRDIHEAVKEAQDYAFGLIKPGVNIRENEKAM